MPSWNIHIAQTEQLVERGGAVARTVFDRNAFLFGNLVPDIYVGYMVPGITEPIPYRVTHFAKPEPIPKPREQEFWETYVAPAATRLGVSCGDGARLEAEPIPASSIDIERETMNRIHYPARYEDADEPPAQASSLDDAVGPDDLARSEFDLLLGVWAHLLADNIWNTRVNEYLDAHGGKPSEQFRIKKQGDFDWFGKTLPIVSLPRATERLMRAAEAFPQYKISRYAVLVTIGVTHEIVRENQGSLAHPPYRLLTDEFFASTFEEVVSTTDILLTARLA